MGFYPSFSQFRSVENDQKAKQKNMNKSNEKIDLNLILQLVLKFKLFTRHI